MNTPPAPLQPIIEEAKNGLFHYFGHNHTSPTNILGQQFDTQIRQDTQQHAILLKYSPSRVDTLNDDLNMLSDTSFSSPSSFNPNNANNLNANNSTNSNITDEENDEIEEEENQNMINNHINIQEKRQSLSRKLAQRRPKQELIERGILPPSRVSMLHYNRMKHLEKAQLQDILRIKIEKRPNRELLVQKNILPDSAPKAAPSLQLKCNELKRARRRDDLNEKLAKRPGPLELVESGILVSSDSSLTEAIKDGKLVYPRTSQIFYKSNHATHQNEEEMLNYDQQQQQQLFDLDDASLNYLNFDFNNLTDNEDSNASSQTSNSTAKTSNTIASFSSSATSSLNMNPIGSFSANSTSTQLGPLPPPAPPLPASFMNNSNEAPENPVFYSSTEPSPNTPSASMSPFNFLNGAKVSSKSSVNTTGTPRQKASKSSASSTTSSKSTSLITGSSNNNKLTRNNSNSSSLSTSSNTTGGTSNSASGSGAAPVVSTSKKLSQLIFHEYRGPNQKSSKTSISLKSSNSNNNNKTNKIVNANGAATPANGSVIGQMNTNEIYFDDSNDSMNSNLKSAMLVELNPHKIRMKQQKIFLKYNNLFGNNASPSTLKSKEDTNKIDEMIVESSSQSQQQEQVGRKEETNNGNDLVKQIILTPRVAGGQQTQFIQNNLITATTNSISSSSPITLSQFKQTGNGEVDVTNSFNSQSTIQLVPIGDLQMLLNANFIPIRIASAGVNNSSIIADNSKKDTTTSIPSNGNIYTIDTSVGSSQSPLLINTNQSSLVNLNPLHSIVTGTIPAATSSVNVPLLGNQNSPPNSNNSPFSTTTQPTISSSFQFQKEISNNKIDEKTNADANEISNNTQIQAKTNSNANTTNNTNTTITTTSTSTTITSSTSTNALSSINKSSNTFNILINNKKFNIEEMNLNELRDECRRRKLTVTGNKQKLIERIKSNILLLSNSSTTTLNEQVLKQSGAKSPDSGVNMDSSPSVISSEQSPSNNTNVSCNQSKFIGYDSTQQKQQPQVKCKTNLPSSSSNLASTKSNLDDFFNFLDIENLGVSKNTKIQPENKQLPKATTATSAASIVQTTFIEKTNKDKMISSSDSFIEPFSKENKSRSGTTTQTEGNLSETAATLEMSLKNSAELLKQLSSIGQIEHLHQLEKQMKESMQLIEKLKSASNKQQTSVTNFSDQLKPEVFDMNSNQQINHVNKLKSVNSMPSNLKELESLIHSQQDQHNQFKNIGLESYLIQNSSFNNIQAENLNTSVSNNINNNNINNSKSIEDSQFLIKLTIPPVKTTFDLNNYQYDMQPSEMSNETKITILNATNNQLQKNINSNNDLNPYDSKQLKEEETVYQFDTLMKELSTSMQTNQENERVTFTCNSQEDEENSNETNLNLTLSSKQNQQTFCNLIDNRNSNDNSFIAKRVVSSLPSINSLIEQKVEVADNHLEENKISTNQLYEARQMKTKQLDHEPQLQQTQQEQHIEMDWNETEFLQFCQEFDNTDNLFSNANTNTNANKIIILPSQDLNEIQKPIKNEQSNSFLFESNNNIQNDSINNNSNSSNNNIDSIKNTCKNASFFNMVNNQNNSDSFKKTDLSKFSIVDSTSSLTFNDGTNILSYTTTQDHQYQNHLDSNNQLMSDQQNFISFSRDVRSTLFIDNSNGNNLNEHVNTNTNVLNINNNANAMNLPWEFDNDFQNSIATYLQSSTV